MKEQQIFLGTSVFPMAWIFNNYGYEMIDSQRGA